MARPEWDRSSLGYVSHSVFQSCSARQETFCCRKGSCGTATAPIAFALRHSGRTVHMALIPAASAPGMGSPASAIRTGRIPATISPVCFVQCMEKVGVDETQVGATSATGPSGAPVKSGFLDKTPQPGFSRPKTRWFVLHQVPGAS